MLFVRFDNNPSPVIRSTQFQYCTVSNPGTGADDAFVLKRGVQRNAPVRAGFKSVFSLDILTACLFTYALFTQSFLCTKPCNIIWHLRMFIQRLFRRRIELNQQPMPLCFTCCFTSTEVRWPTRDGDRVGRGRESERIYRGNRPKKTGETVDRRQNNGSVKAVSPRHCPATCALRNCCFNCLDRVTMPVAPLLTNNMHNSKQKTSNLLSPAPPPYS